MLLGLEEKVIEEGGRHRRRNGEKVVEEEAEEIGRASCRERVL